MGVHIKVNWSQIEVLLALLVVFIFEMFSSEEQAHDRVCHLALSRQLVMT